jgi:hypothetical protein
MIIVKDFQRRNMWAINSSTLIEVRRFVILILDTGHATLIELGVQLRKQIIEVLFVSRHPFIHHPAFELG